MKIRLMGAELSGAGGRTEGRKDGQTDGRTHTHTHTHKADMTTVIVTFCNFAKAHIKKPLGLFNGDSKRHGTLDVTKRI